MKYVTTVCARDCYDGCSLIVAFDDTGKIVSVTGDPEHPFTQGFVCPRGAKDHENLTKNRVTAPCVRQNGKLEQTGWENALNLVSQQLRDTLEKHGPEAVLYLNYAGNAGILTETYPQRLWHALGATQTDYALCSKSGHHGFALHYGASYGLDPLDLPAMKLIVFWGFNAAVSSSHTWALACKAKKLHDTKIVVIDPVKTHTAQHANLWIQPQPGTDVALAYGIINYLIQHQYEDLNFIKTWTLGFEQLQEEAREWTPEKVEAITGVPQKQIEQLGEAYYKLNLNATMIGIGLQKNHQGADQVRAVSLIPALLGQPRGFFYSNSKAYSINTDLIAGESLTQTPSKLVPQVGLADLVQQGKFKFIYVSGMNPVLTLPNQHAFRQGLEREDVFVVVHDTHWTKTCEYADVVLPAATYLEKDDLVIPWTHHFVRYSPQVIEPVTDSRREIQVMQELAKRLDLKEKWLYEEPWEAIKPAFEDAFEDGDLAALKSGQTLKLKRKPANVYATPSGKIELFASQAEHKGWNPLPQQLQEFSVSKNAGFVFLTSATSNYTSTQFQEVYGKIPAIVLIHPEDAQQQGIEEGETLVLSNDLGSFKVKAVISDTVLKGVLWSPRQSEDLDGSPQNCLMSSEPQAIGSGPRFNSTVVTLSHV